LTGAVVGGLFIGVMWAFSDGFVKQYIPGWGPQWTTSVIFGVLVLVLVFRPQRLVRRADGGQGMTALRRVAPADRVVSAAIAAWRRVGGGRVWRHG
jgi:drug/metabolite transporter (DMT)-like permease